VDYTACNLVNHKIRLSVLTGSSLAGMPGFIAPFIGNKVTIVDVVFDDPQNPSSSTR
jgi:hypothetical protein